MTTQRSYTQDAGLYAAAFHTGQVLLASIGRRPVSFAAPVGDCWFSSCPLSSEDEDSYGSSTEADETCTAINVVHVCMLQDRVYL